MAEPIAVEENLDDGVMPESRNFICGVVEGLMESAGDGNPADSKTNMNQDQSSPSHTLLHLSNNPWLHGNTEFDKYTIDWTKRQLNDTCSEVLKLLNKLSESNFDVIASKFCNVKFKDENIETIANFLLKKSISEPLRVELYASLVKSLFNVERNEESAILLLDFILTQCNIVLFTSANSVLASKIESAENAKFKGTMYLYSELFSLDMVKLSPFLMSIFGFQQTCSLDNLCLIVPVIQKCGKKIEHYLRPCSGDKLIWTKILESIEEKTVNDRNILPMRIFLMLSNILLLKKRNWKSAVGKIIWEDDENLENPGSGTAKKTTGKYESSGANNASNRRGNGAKRQYRRRQKKETSNNEVENEELSRLNNEIGIARKTTGVTESSGTNNASNRRENGAKPNNFRRPNTSNNVVENEELSGLNNESVIARKTIGVAELSGANNASNRRGNGAKRNNFQRPKTSNNEVENKELSGLNNESGIARKTTGVTESSGANNASNRRGNGAKRNNFRRPKTSNNEVENEELSGLNNEIGMSRRTTGVTESSMANNASNRRGNGVKRQYRRRQKKETSNNDVENEELSRLNNESGIARKTTDVAESSGANNASNRRGNGAKRQYRRRQKKETSNNDVENEELSRLNNESGIARKTTDVAESSGANNALNRRGNGTKRQYRRRQETSNIEEFELNTSINPWKRMQCRADATAIERTLFGVRVLLNKLNTANFPSITKQFCLEFNEENSVTILDELFKKASVEHLFAERYAEMLSNVFDMMNFIDGFHKMEIIDPNENGNVPHNSSRVNEVFLKQMKNCVDKLLECVTNLVEREKETNIDDKNDGENSETVAERKTQLVNALIFIAALFKYDLVNISLVLSICSKLTENPSQQNLESLVIFLTKSGEKIDTKKTMSSEYETVWNNVLLAIDKAISNRCELSNRIYFMLVDLVDLRRREWVPKVVHIPENKTIARNKNAKTRQLRKKSPTARPRRKPAELEERREPTQEENEGTRSLEETENLMVQNILKELDTVDNPWRRGEFKQELSDTERTIMEAKSLLNKLAENNFTSIVNQFSKLKFSPETIEHIVNVLFIKAILETKFTELHAKFVRSVSDILDNAPIEVTDFDLKTLIIKKCLLEIDNMNAATNDIYDLGRMHLNEDSEATPKEKAKDKKVTVDFLPSEYKEVLKTKISVGTCQFLGELFNANIVEAKFLLTTLVNNLLPYETEESIECAVKLISVVGKKLDALAESSSNEDIEAGWNLVMKDIAIKASPVNRDRWSNRIFFMLLDVMDLKQRDWLPRVIIVPTRQFKAPKKDRGF